MDHRDADHSGFICRPVDIVALLGADKGPGHQGGLEAGENGVRGNLPGPFGRGKLPAPDGIRLLYRQEDQDPGAGSPVV